MLCLTCFRWSPLGSPFCSGCGRSFGARYCGAKKRHANALNALFCAHCGSQRLTDPTLFLPATWLLRGLALVVLFFVARGAWPSLWPVVERGFVLLINILCPTFNVVVGWLTSAVALYFLIWLFASFVPDEFGKPMQKVMQSGVKLLLKVMKGLLRGVFQLLWRVVAGKSKPQSP